MTALAFVLAGLSAPTLAQGAARAESRPRAEVQNELNTIRSELQDLRQAIEQLVRAMPPKAGVTVAAGGDDRGAAMRAMAETARAQAQAAAEQARTQARAAAEKARAAAQAARAQALAERTRERAEIGRTEAGQTVIARPVETNKADGQVRARVLTVPGLGASSVHSKACTCDCPCCVALRGMAPHTVATGRLQPGSMLRALATTLAPMAPMQLGFTRAAPPAQVDRRCTPARGAIVVPTPPTPPAAPKAPTPAKPAKKAKGADTPDIEVVEAPRVINV